MIRSRGAGGAAAAAAAPKTAVAAASRGAHDDDDDVVVVVVGVGDRRAPHDKRTTTSNRRRRRKQQQQQQERQCVLLLLSGTTTTIAVVLILILLLAVDDLPPWKNHDDHPHLLHSSTTGADFSSFGRLQLLLTTAQQTSVSVSSTTTTTSTNNKSLTIDHHHHQHEAEEELEDEQPCRYDGHCPIGTTCAVAYTHHKDQEIKEEHDATLSSSSSSLKWPGRCRTISIADDDHSVQPSTTECIDACRAELQLDEHYYHQEAWPDIMRTYATANSTTLAGAGVVVGDGRPPHGCVLIYKRRLPDHAKEEFVAKEHVHDDDALAHYSDKNDPADRRSKPPSIRHWTQKSRFRHVVRVDPVAPRRRRRPSHDAVPMDDTNKEKNNSNDDDPSWMAYCTAPCQNDLDCQPISSSTFPAASPTLLLPFVCQEGACQRNAQFWEGHIKKRPHLGEPSATAEDEQSSESSELVIVTGADALYFAGLVNLIQSAQHWAPNVKMVVYNLGQWSPEQVAWIRQMPNVLSVEWSDSTNSDGSVGGIPRTFPDHVRQAKLYAWKPIIIQEALQKYKMIFWIDAGSTLTGPIAPVLDILKRTGIFLVKGQDDDMAQRSAAQTYEWFNVSKTTLRTGPHFSGNTQAYLSPSRYVDSIVNRNAACALNVNCISPPGATIHNHRYDQTSLSICAYQPNVMAPHYTEYLASSRDQLPAGFPEHEDAAAAAAAASFRRFIWTSRQKSSDYISADLMDILTADSKRLVDLKRQERKLLLKKKLKNRKKKRS